MCLAQGPQRSDAGEARTRCLTVSSPSLTALPVCKGQKDIQTKEYHIFRKLKEETISIQRVKN